MNHDIKRMLELAAKAIGGDLSEGHTKKRTGPTWDDWVWIGPLGINDPQTGCTIHPQTHDGDSRRLEVKLGLLVDVDWDSRTATAVLPDRVEMIHTIVHVVNIPEGSDGMAETRLAVLMAAAAVGEVMP